MKNSIGISLLFVGVCLCLSACDYLQEPNSEDLKSGKMESVKGVKNKTVTLPFKADFTGEYTEILVGAESGCDDPYNCKVHVDFEGTATHLGKMYGSFRFCACGPDGEYAPSESFMVAANGDSLFVTISGQVVDGRLDDHPNYVTSWWRDEFFITGGTGKFLGATGGGWSDDYNSSNDPYSHHHWTGNITLKRGNIPDLVISSLEVTSFGNSTISYSYTIKNVGTAPANLAGTAEDYSDNVSIQSFLSPYDALIDSDYCHAGGLVLGTSDDIILMPGESLSGSFEAEVYCDISEMKYLVSIVDFYERLPESDESNNMTSTELGMNCYPDVPAPVLSFDGLEAVETDSTTYYYYWLDVQNWMDIPDALFAASTDLPPCGSNTSASRSWVQIMNAEGSGLGGFCALSKSEDLRGIWFAIEKGDDIPEEVYIVINDRLCEISYKSNTIEIP